MHALFRQRFATLRSDLLSILSIYQYLSIFTQHFYNEMWLKCSLCSKNCNFSLLPAIFFKLPITRTPDQPFSISLESSSYRESTVCRKGARSSPPFYILPFPAGLEFYLTCSLYEMIPLELHHNSVSFYPKYNFALIKVLESCISHSFTLYFALLIRSYLITHTMSIIFLNSCLSKNHD